MNTVIKKRVSHAFSKDTYLLGECENGEKYWLEAPSWDCSWYWGFGYVETYTNGNDPDKAKDITSHQHIDGLFKKDGKINLWHSALHKHTYTDKEADELNELFASFYEMKIKAEKIHQHEYNSQLIEVVSVQPLNDQHAIWIDINTNKIPELTDRIIEILTPDK